MYRLLLVAVILLAFWLRLESLDTMPPAISDDEAVNVIDAFHIARTGVFPLYEDPNRPEPLYRIFLAIGTLFFGQSIWAFRFVTVILGTLAVAAAAWAAAECLHDLGPQKRQLAALAAAGVLAVAISHITLSRALYRGLQQSLFMLLYTALLMRGLRRGHWRDFVLSGFALSGAMYSYLAALALPASLVAVGLSLILFQRKRWRMWLPRMAIAGLVLTILMSFVIVLFTRNPVMIIGRAAELREGQGSFFEPQRFEGLFAHFFTRGDDNPQYNVESAPFLPPVFNILFVVGVIGLLTRWKKPSSALIGAMFILSALPEMSTSEIPHGLRASGQFAVFPLVVAVGVGWILKLIERVGARATGQSPLRNRRIYTGATVALALLIVVDGVYARNVYRNYWGQPYTWRMFGETMPIGDWFFRTDRKEFAEWLIAQEGPLLVPVDELATKTTRSWLMQDYPNIRAIGAMSAANLPNSMRVVIPYRLELSGLMRDARQFGLLDGDTITILPPFDAATLDTIAQGLENAESVLDLRGELMAQTFMLTRPNWQFEPENQRFQIDTDYVEFADEVALVGWRGPDTLTEGMTSAAYTLDWQALRPLGHDYSSFLQLQTQDQQVIAGDDVRILRWIFPSSIWRAEDTIADAHVLTLPETPLQPGAFRLVAGMYPAVFPNERLPVFDRDNAPLGDAALLGWVKVPQREEDQPVIPAEADAIVAQLASIFSLRGAEAELLENGQVRIVIYWQSMVERMNINATIFVHLVDENGEIVAQADSQPWGGQYPTFIWSEGEIVRTDHMLDIGDAVPETIRVYVGMYTFPDLARLSVVQDGQPVEDGRVYVGTLEAISG